MNFTFGCWVEMVLGGTQRYQNVTLVNNFRTEPPLKLMFGLVRDISIILANTRLA